MEKYIKAMNDRVMAELIYSPDRNWMTLFCELNGVITVADYDPEISLEQHADLLKIRSGMLTIYEAVAESLKGA